MHPMLMTMFADAQSVALREQRRRPAAASAARTRARRRLHAAPPAPGGARRARLRHLNLRHGD